MKRIILGAVGLAGIALIVLGSTVLGQDGGVVTEPTLGQLTTATGLAAFVTLLMNLVRGLFPSDFAFDRWAPLAATVVGVAVSVGVALFTGAPETPESLLSAVLIGVFAGQLSQNVNTTVQRAAGNVDTP